MASQRKRGEPFIFHNSVLFVSEFFHCLFQLRRFLFHFADARGFFFQLRVQFLPRRRRINCQWMRSNTRKAPLPIKTKSVVSLLRLPSRHAQKYFLQAQFILPQAGEFDAAAHQRLRQEGRVHLMVD